MILYRNMRYEEYKEIANGKDFPLINRQNIFRENTFEYGGKDDQLPRMHFFKNIDFADMYIGILGDMIVKCDVPDSLIDEHGFGFYHFERIPYDVPIPECTVRRADFSVDFIKEINPSVRKNSKYVLNENEKMLYRSFLNQMYNEWIKKAWEEFLLSNMSNIKMSKNAFKKYLDSKGEFDFAYYVIEHLGGRSIEDVLKELATCYFPIEPKSKIRKK